jgi:hypothetical protein
MGKKLVSRTAKVLSETKKIKDKGAVAIAYEHIPRNPAEQQHGSIYAVIEIEDKSGRAEEIAEKIIDLLYEHYYEDTEKEPLAAFEGALAKINDELTERSSEGQIEWLGKLNAVLAVLTGNNLHVTQAGKAEAYLYRGEYVMHVTDGLAGDSVNPQRTFINIASGDLTEKDRLAIVTPGVFFKISKSELKKYATEKSPRVAAEDLSRLLIGDNGTTKPNAILLMEMVSPESFVNDETADEKTEVWVPDKESTEEKLGEGVAGGTVKIFDYLGKAYEGASVFLVQKAIPRIKQSLKKAKKGYQKFHREAGAESIILNSEERISHPTNTDLEPEKIGGVLEVSEPLPEKAIRIKETGRPRLLSLERFDFNALDRAKAKFSNRKFRFRLPGKKASLLYLGIAGALIAGLVLFLVFRNQTGMVAGTNKELQNKYEQAVSLYDKSQQEISSSEYQNAVQNLTAAEKLIGEVIAGGYQVTESESLRNKILSSKDQASRITRNTATVVHEFDAKVSEIFSDGKLIYGLAFESGALYSFDPVASTTATIASNNDLGGGKINYATLVTAARAIVCYTDNDKVYKISLTTGKATGQTVSGTLEETDALNHFGTNIYALAKNDNQIYRRLSSSSGYGAKSNYFKEAPDLSKVTDIAIDGALYTVSATGSVNKYTSGVQDDYSMSGLPIEYSDIRGIYTTPDTDGIYLFTPGLLIKIDQNGKFVAQYAQDNAGDITSVIPDDRNNKVYFLSGNKVYSIKF